MMSTPRALAAADELETWRLAVLDAGTNSCRFDQGGAAVIIAKHYAALESTVEAMARSLERSVAILERHCTPECERIPCHVDLMRAALASWRALEKP